MTDPHTLLVEADAQLKGIINLVAPASEQTLDHLTGFELSMTLQPIAERIEKALKLLTE
jgi:hypothetical protein